ncbi:GNAT family N-acetyltransferase [Sulfitobacter sp. S0837]|uniref:GNAT family N-acetyltransferase n=1 Tax=Sulfitobacter maritimus TaxID=2741719 RepID=UPI0015819A12|nr:GNAT family N-acetyltransferase [Sulfitobacter maritimus]NUH66655.1 GNAT family N-acetyltransferase [Sulfitobacter maritimus]
MPVIRPAEKSDLPMVLDLAHALAAYHGDTATLTLAALERDSLGPAPWITLLVAEGTTGLRGYAALTPQMQLQFGARGMDLHHLFVCDTARGKGLGRALVQAALDHAQQRGCTYVTVGTDPRNQRVQTFYRRAGFDQITPDPRFKAKLA